LGRRLDLNLASAEEMEALPGIGPALAARIVELRTLRGGFRTVDELLEVRGIGAVVLRRLRPLVVVGGAGL
jgi:competence protein ComEA